MKKGSGFYNLEGMISDDSINKYLLTIRGSVNLGVLDVESIDGKESLSKPYSYKITFTSKCKDIPPESLLNIEAMLQIRAPNNKWSKYVQGSAMWINERQIEGVITSCSLISTSADESLYEIRLEHKLALLSRRRRSAIYLNINVPKLVTQILKEHFFADYEIDFDKLLSPYPDREMIVQWEESDLAFVSRILSEVGIWFRIENHHAVSHIMVLIFSDSQSRYIFDQKIMHASHAGLTANDYAIDKLVSKHNLVSAAVKAKNFDYRLANSLILNADADGAEQTSTTYGVDYRYADIHHQPGSKFAEEQPGESSWFYAKLHHEIILNNQSILSGVTTSPSIAPGMVLEIDGTIPQAFTSGFVVTAMRVTGRRDAALQSQLIGIPYSERVCFRPQPLPRPRIVGTVPAIVSSRIDNDKYAHIDVQGRYWVKFDFDLDQHKQGYESMPVRLARIYAGDTYGHHFPLIQGAEVAIAFEGGDPERPFIAHALHHAPKPDLVTSRNNTRNVIRTAGHNKLRMEDRRGQEHVKLSTEYAKTQLNMGHLVDAGGKPRGEGAELRTDERGVLRAAKGILLTTEAQPKAQGKQLDMNAVVQQLQAALVLATSLQQSALTAQALNVEMGQQQQLNAALEQLTQPGLVAYADQGMALLTPETMALSANKDLSLNAANNGSFNVFKKLSMAVGQGLSLFSRAIGIKIIAAKDDISVQAQRGEMGLLSDQHFHIQSMNGNVTISAKKNIQLLCGGGGIRINEDGSVKIFSPAKVQLKGTTLDWSGPESVKDKSPVFQEDQFHRRIKLHGYGNTDDVLKKTKFRLTKASGEIIEGVTDDEGMTPLLDMTEMDEMKMEILPNE
ncbi:MULTISPECIES: type VI secretion system Vgr family protein [Citrobacter]|uniref:type VI secretion system Vgr family protein n=1 Tax=Citrobacter TaxID=544 RepID=UPI00257729B4|nr:type VI secretion system Vgr family protein [Citrobacter sp. Cb009]MDM3445371.1 type VI secretion system tip protein VgrG [Citrobacter sp. Cb009]